MTKPISPEEVMPQKLETMPDEVIQAFNEVIIKNWNGHKSKFRQGEIVACIIDKLRNSGMEALPSRTSGLKTMIFDNHWLDVEDAFRDEGWKVEFDKPGYCEDYDAFFVFRA